MPILSKHAGKSGRGRRVRILITSAVFAIVLALVSGTTAWVGYRHYNAQITRVDVLSRADPHIRRAARQLHAANYLVLGSDTRAGANASFGRKEGAASDTTMIVHLSPARTKATIISIPRDAVVSIPACRNAGGAIVPAHTDLFNAAFATGGASCTVATVQMLTGIEITRYVAVDFTGFIRVVDALGSITVCSPRPVSDPKSQLELRKGNNKLNGKQALAYVRARYTLGDGSDIERIKRQQRFLGSVLREVRGGRLLSGPTTLTSFLDAATKAITVDRKSSFADLRTLLDVLRGLDPAKVTFYTAPIARSNYDPKDPSSQSGVNVLLDAARGRVLYDEVISDRTVTAGAQPARTPTTLTVPPARILVSVTKAGPNDVKAAVARSLVARGFTLSTPSAATTGPTATTTVVTFSRAQFAAAQTVAAAFRASTMKLEASHVGPIQVTIGSDHTTVRAVAVGQPLPSWVPGTAAAGPATVPPGGFTAADSSCRI